MYSEKDILDMLAKGETIDSITKSFTDVINKANKTHQATLAAEAAKTQKKKDLDKLLESIWNFAHKWYKIDVPEMNDEDKEALFKAFDTLFQAYANGGEFSYEITTNSKDEKNNPWTRLDNSIDKIFELDSKIKDFLDSKGF